MTLFDPKSIRILGADSAGNSVVLCNMYVDTISDLPAANAFTGYILSMGCRAVVINDNSVHRLNSAGQWVQIVPGNSTYTRAEIDNIINGINADILSTQTQIDYAINTGAKNYCPYDGFTATDAGTVINDQPINLPAGNYIITFDYTATGGSSSIRLLDNGVSVVNFTINNTASGRAERQFTLTASANQIRFYTGVANTVTNMMIRPAVITDGTFTPYAPTNRELYNMIRGYHP